MRLQKSNFMKRMNSLKLDSSQESESSIESVDDISEHDLEEIKSRHERQSHEDELFNTHRMTHSIVRSEA